MAKDSVKKPRIRKQTKVAVAAKAPTKKTSVKAAASNPLNANSAQKSRNKFLSTLHVLFGGISAAAGIAVLFISNHEARPVTAMHLTLNNLISQSGEKVYAVAIRQLFDVRLSTLLSIILLSTAAYFLIIGGPRKNVYESVLLQKVQTVRWVFLGLVGGLAVATIALLSGLTDLAFLLTLFVLTLVACLLAHLNERIVNPAGKPSWLVFGLNVLCGGLPFVVIAAAIIHASWFGATTLPWYIYAAALTLAFGFAVLVVNNLSYLRNSATKDYSVVERNFSIISFVMIMLFSAIIFAGALL